MYLSDRDIRWAIETGRLIIRPRPEKIDPTSVDLHLDKIDQAKIWDIEAIKKSNKTSGLQPDEVRIGQFDYRPFSIQFLIPLPENPTKPAFRRGHEVVIKPGGFLLWQTQEIVGTADDRADL